MSHAILKAPFPYFGGKKRVADLVWERFGDPINYCEPFFGSGAVLLGRPHQPRCETINDKCSYISNFWRAIAADPEETAKWADWPVNESDLHARHQWLVNWMTPENRERIMTEPDYFDPKVAGWWVWGISQWIGSGWCKKPHWKGRVAFGAGRGIHRQRTDLDRGGKGIHRKILKLQRSSDPNSKLHQKRPMMKRGGVGVHRNTLDRPWRTKPDISGDSGAYGRGIHACGLESITDYFEALADRLRRVRVCCGDWKRIMGPSPTVHIGVTAVFLDPPYGEDAERDNDLYNEEDLNVAKEVHAWCLEHGDDPKLRIALCGYDREHEMPDSWTKVKWRANGGYSNQGDNQVGKDNREQETIWFSPHCVVPSDMKQNELTFE